MALIAYYRVSTSEQSIESQRSALGGSFDKEFSDEGFSGAILARSRPGFADLWKYVREGDEVFVYAVDRLGRDALDVQKTVRELIERGVTVNILGLGAIGRGVGELILAVLAQMAEMERQRIRERVNAGMAAAKIAVEATGRTHNGRLPAGRPMASSDWREVAQWRIDNAATVPATAAHFGISTSTVDRYCRDLRKESTASAIVDK